MTNTTTKFLTTAVALLLVVGQWVATAERAHAHDESAGQDCAVGMILAPGDSCAYQYGASPTRRTAIVSVGVAGRVSWKDEDRNDLAITHSGTMDFLGNCLGAEHHCQSHGGSGLRAIPAAHNSWKIIAAGSARPNCRVGMVLNPGDSCAYDYESQTMRFDGAQLVPMRHTAIVSVRSSGAIRWKNENTMENSHDGGAVGSGRHCLGQERTCQGYDGFRAMPVGDRAWKILAAP